MNLLCIVGLLGQAAATTPQTGDTLTTNQNLLSLLIHANIVVQLTLLLLIGFSIVSWAIIASKKKQLGQSKKTNEQFFRLFWESTTVEEMVNQKKFRKSPAFNVFKAAIDTLRDTPNKAQAKVMVEREIRRTTEDEIEAMEYGIPFLATTGSAAPFIGLFGTVWGILNAFWKIGKTGASSLAIVGPHIAEALIATAIGLAAAIPAVIFYNLYVNQVRLLSKNLQEFSDDLITRIQHEYFQ